MDDSKLFLSRLQTNPPTTKNEWLTYVCEALGYANSPDRHIIAMWFVGKGAACFAELAKQQTNKTDLLAAYHDPEIQPIMDALAELELPDGHIAPGYMDDYSIEEAKVYDQFVKMYVSYKWRKLAELLQAQ